MAYTVKDYKNKKAVKDALAAGETVEVYQPGMGTIPADGTISLEGPHYPKPHTWYGTGTMKGGKLVKIV
jgi:hypothetical protein